MTLNEACDIAFTGEHATVTYDLAAYIIRKEGHSRNRFVYAQLAELKAEMQRLKAHAELEHDRND